MPGGGPDGDNDAFLSYTTDTVNTGGRFLVLNGVQWRGDYLGAEITGITAQAKNLGQAGLHMRLLLEGPGGAFFSLQSAALPVDGDWQSIFFPISSTALDGGTNLEATLASVNRIRIFHNPDASFPGPFVNASIGLDNIQAIPEPTGATLIAMSVLLIPLCRRRIAFPGISSLDTPISVARQWTWKPESQAKIQRVTPFFACASGFKIIAVALSKLSNYE